jgi:hypothetical protein
MNVAIYAGIVVQNDDPSKAGRVKVFIPGITNTVYDAWNNDSTDKEFYFIDGSIIPIMDQLQQDLPWADCATSLFGGDSSQIMIGDTATDLTQPAGLFSIPSVGSHVNVFFRNGNSRFPVYFAGAHGATEWTTAIGDDYPVAGTDTNVHVINSSKHGFRFVDTSEREEIILKHFSGSYAQFILNDTNCHTVDFKTETIGMDCTTTISGSEISTTLKDSTETIGGNETINIDGDQTINVGGAENITIGAGQTVNVTGDITLKASGSITIESAGGKIVLDASGVTITGTAINLN